MLIIIQFMKHAVQSMLSFLSNDFNKLDNNWALAQKSNVGLYFSYDPP